MAEFHLSTHNQSPIYPLFGRDTACVPDSRAKIALSQTHVRSVKSDLMLMHRIEIDEVDKTVKDCLFARLIFLQMRQMPVVECVVVMHLGCHQVAYQLTIVYRLTDDVPKCFKNMERCVNVILAD